MKIKEIEPSGGRVTYLAPNLDPSVVCHSMFCIKKNKIENFLNFVMLKILNMLNIVISYFILLLYFKASWDL